MKIFQYNKIEIKYNLLELITKKVDDSKNIFFLETLYKTANSNNIRLI